MIKRLQRKSPTQPQHRPGVWVLKHKCCFPHTLERQRKCRTLGQRTLEALIDEPAAQQEAC